MKLNAYFKKLNPQKNWKANKRERNIESNPPCACQNKLSASKVGAFKLQNENNSNTVSTTSTKIKSKKNGIKEIIDQLKLVILDA